MRGEPMTAGMGHDPVADPSHSGLGPHQEDRQSHCLIRAGIGHRERDAFTSVNPAPLSLDERLPQLRGIDRGDSRACRNAGIGCRLADAVEITSFPATEATHAVS